MILDYSASPTVHDLACNEADPEHYGARWLDRPDVMALRTTLTLRCQCNYTFVENFRLACENKGTRATDGPRENGNHRLELLSPELYVKSSGGS